MQRSPRSALLTSSISATTRYGLEVTLCSGVIRACTSHRPPSRLSRTYAMASSPYSSPADLRTEMICYSVEFDERRLCQSVNPRGHKGGTLMRFSGMVPEALGGSRHGRRHRGDGGDASPQSESRNGTSPQKWRFIKTLFLRANQKLKIFQDFQNKETEIR